MSYNAELQGNNQELQEILAEVNNLPEAGVNESTVVAKISAHNTANDSHQDIRLMIKEHEDAVNALLNSDDHTLNETKEIVAYIKNNKSLIDSITDSKVSKTDIVNNLTTNVTNKPLSAAQGVALKALIDALGVSKLDASKLTESVNTALAQAKASGEFDGEKGDPGASVTVSNVTTSSADGGSNVVTFSDGKTLTVKNGSKGSPGATGKSAYAYAKDGGYAGTEEEFAEDINPDNIKAELSQIETPKIVSSVAEMIDTTKHYVLNGNIYYNKTVVTEGETIRTYPNQFVPSTAQLNTRLSGSSGSASTSNGYFVTDFIEVPNYATTTPYYVRLNWEMSSSVGDDIKVMFYNSSKTKLGYTPIADVGHAVPNSVIANGKTTINTKIQLKTGTGPDESQVAYIKLQLSAKSSLTALTSTDIAKLEITLDAVYTETTTESTTKQEWVNSGISYSPTFKTDLVGVLGEGNVIYLSDNLPSGTYTLKYGDETYTTIGTITVE